MTGAEYIIEILKKYKVTDAFGIPGAVILDLLYAFEHYGINPHLCFHEQAAGFAACGYAQTKNSLGVAYATKGPGFTNLITPIADAYYDSIPVLFITAHSHKKSHSSVRFMANQEIDTVSMVSDITKYAEYIETEEGLIYKTEKACRIAMENRKGPILLDFYSDLFNQVITHNISHVVYSYSTNKNRVQHAVNLIKKVIRESKRPIILIGNGIKQSNKLKNLEQFCQNNKIPILASRTALDCFAYSDAYFGYIGSRGLRYSNFILAKCDAIISIGNRMAYNLNSESFNIIMQKEKIVRIEIDENEFERIIPYSIEVLCDLEDILQEIEKINVPYAESHSWFDTCNKIKQTLYEFDTNEPVKKIADILSQIPQNITVVCDVGNNALWFSRAHNYLKSENKVLFSMGLACLGNALCKAIGVVYANKQFAACIIGDQGLQMNIQELEFLSKNKIPVLIILINNHLSGMILNWEKQKFGYALHSSPESGYGTPDFKLIAHAYNVNYIEYSGKESVKQAFNYCQNNHPVLLNVLINPSDVVIPSLPKENPCYEMEPAMPFELYKNMLDL